MKCSPNMEGQQTQDTMKKSIFQVQKKHFHKQEGDTDKILSVCDFLQFCGLDEDTSVSYYSARKTTRACHKRHRSIGGQAKFDSKEIKAFVEKFVCGEDVISDGSRAYSLPTVTGRHKDLKSISSETMTCVLEGKYNKIINSVKIIDCRYPYEFIGGHITGAENRYTPDMIQELIDSFGKPKKLTKSCDILIFHCEFSSERAPKLLRFLRNLDRQINSFNYPALCFPEVYLLEGGYKAFYNYNNKFCVPKNYTPMLATCHVEDLRHFRSKSKSCTNILKKSSYKL